MLVPNRRTLFLGGLGILLNGDSIVPAAPQSSDSGPTQPCQAPGELWILPEWSSASSASRVKRGHFTFDTKRQPVSFMVPGTCYTLDLGLESGTSAQMPFPASPPARLSQAKRNT